MQSQNETKIIKIRLIWFFIAIIFIALIYAFFKNYIFAMSSEEQINSIAFEKNQHTVDVINVMFVNTDSNKKLVNEQREIQFEVEYEENPNLPKDEEQIKQEGKNGRIQVTALQVYQNNELSDEEIIENIMLEDSIKQIIYRGTSEFLKKYSVHIGDKMYLLEAEDLKEQKTDESIIICQIPRYLNVIVDEAGEDWLKVTYNGKQGFIKTANITSDSVTPLITEKNRIATLKNNLNIEMDLSNVSGLTLSDYKTIFSHNVADKNNIFENNYKYFYDAEQKYKINGIFLASIGIHESAWGTSRLAVDKNNLFGFTAYDSDPYNSATTFISYEDAIDTVANTLAVKYLHTSGTSITDNLTATGIYYNGTTVKSVNVRYASDENWALKVYSYMEYLYDKL